MDVKQIVAEAKKSLNTHHGNNITPMTMTYCRAEIFDIAVSRRNIPSALHFLSQLLKSFAAFNIEMDLRSEDRKYTYIKLPGQQLNVYRRMRIGLREITQRETIEKGRKQYLPTGVFCLKIDSLIWKREWRKDPDALSGHIDDMVITIVEKLKAFGIDQEESDRAFAIEEAGRLKDEQEMALAKKDLIEFQNLRAAARHWQEARLIGQYIAAYESNLTDEERQTEELATWLTWAKKTLEWFGPITNAENETLRFVRRDEFAKLDPIDRVDMYRLYLDKWDRK